MQTFPSRIVPDAELDTIQVMHRQNATFSACMSSSAELQDIIQNAIYSSRGSNSRRSRVPHGARSDHLLIDYNPSKEEDAGSQGSTGSSSVSASCSESSSVAYHGAAEKRCPKPVQQNIAMKEKS